MDSYTLRYNHDTNDWTVLQWRLFKTKFGTHYRVAGKKTFSTSEQAADYMNREQRKNITNGGFIK